MKTKELILCSLFAALLCCSVIITIPLPFTTVPITFQPLIVAMAGAILGKKLGSISVIIYILLGFCGLPVFSGMKGGASILFGPTGGYIIGFILQAFITGFLVERFLINRNSKNFIKIFLICIIGLIATYILGTIQFMIVSNVTIIKALTLAVIPFVPLDILKMFMASFITIIVRNNIYNINLEKN